MARAWFLDRVYITLLEWRGVTEIGDHSDSDLSPFVPGWSCKQGLQFERRQDPKSRAGRRELGNLGRNQNRIKVGRVD